MVFKMFVYQQTFTLLELKEQKGIKFVIVSKSKGVCNSKLTPLYNDFLHNKKKLSGCRIRIQFNMIVLVVEQNSYTNKLI